MENKSLRRRFFEALAGTPKPTQQPIGTPIAKELKIAVNQIKDVVKTSVGVYQIPSFDSLIKIFLADQVLRDGIYDFSDECVSSDIFISVDKLYTFTVDGKTAQEVLDKWVADNHIHDFCRTVSAEITAFGNSFARLSNTGGGLSRIPLESAWHMVPVDISTSAPPIQEAYLMQLTPIYSCEMIDLNTLIHFRLNALGRMEPFGVGLMQGITARPVLTDGTTIESIYDARLLKRHVCTVGMVKWATGNVWIFMPDLPLEQLDALNEKVGKMSPTGNRLVLNKEGSIKLEINDRSEGWDRFAEQMDSEFLACVAPYQKLGLGARQSFTKSTAAQMGKVYDRRLNAVRNVLKGAFRDILIAVLKSVGFKDPETAHPNLNFAQEESPPPTVGDLDVLVAGGIITPNECRHLLRENQKLDIQGDIKDGDKPRQQQMGKQPTDPEARDITMEKTE